MGRPRGYEARLNRIEEAIAGRAVSTRRVLDHAKHAPGRPNLLDALEWSVEQLTGKPVPTKPERRR